MTQLDEARAQIAVLREALGQIVHTDIPLVTCIKVGRAALDATPSDCLTQIKARFLDDVADRFPVHENTMISGGEVKALLRDRQW